MSTKVKNILFTLVILLSIAGPIGMIIWAEQLPLTAGGRVCETGSPTLSYYNNIIFVADLPNVPKLATHSGKNHLDLGYMYRSVGQDTFVLSVKGARCGEIVNPDSLAELIGTNQFDSAFVVPENPNSYLLQALSVVAAFAFGALRFGLTWFYGSLSDKYPGRWEGTNVFIPDDPYAIQKEVKKLFGIEQNKNVS